MAFYTSFKSVLVFDEVDGAFLHIHCTTDIIYVYFDYQSSLLRRSTLAAVAALTLTLVVSVEQ
jgi:hypothetical protein